MKYGDETVVFFEIDQPQCALTYASAPCTAVLGTTGSRKCYNGRATCQSTANYAPTATVTLRFARPQEGLAQYGWVIPSMLDLDITPLAINLAAMEKNGAALGQREVVRVRLTDHQHADVGLDKYRLERYTGAASSPSVPFDPNAQGTFWGKWQARNPYYSSYNCRVRIGTIGQALFAMRVYNYILERIEGPSDGTVNITAKDLFSKVEARKAVAPRASKGELQADITGTPATFTLSPVGIGNTEYPASGFVCIGSEIIQFTRSADVMTVVLRAALNTVQVDHKTQDLVQLVLSYAAIKPHDIAYDLLTTYGGVAAANIDKADWNLSAASITDVYTGRVASPASVSDLLGELEVQAGFTIYPDPATNMIKFVALRAVAVDVTVTDRDWIVDKSLSIKRDDSKRVTQVWVYYGQVDPTQELEKSSNFRSRVVSPDTNAESPSQYGSPSIKRIFSRWVPQFGRQAATTISDRILALFRDAPLEARLRYHATRSGKLQLAKLFYLQTADVQDDVGAQATSVMVPTRIKYGEDEDELTAQEVRYGITPPPGTEQTVYIENNIQNINLRTIFDSLYDPPTASTVTRFIVEAGVVVSSASTGTAAVRSGTWPAGALVTLEVQSAGQVRGKGGYGGRGGDYNQNGYPGETGGDAVQADSPMRIDNKGKIWAGGGGAGGGGGLYEAIFPPRMGGGGAGSGAAGVDAGAGNVGGTTVWSPPGDMDGGSSTAGTADAPGTPGAGRVTPSGSRRAGNGGVAGYPGEDGQDGEAAQSDVFQFKGVGGAHGAKGRYIVGNGNVTWLTLGDVKGGVA